MPICVIEPSMYLWPIHLCYCHSKTKLCLVVHNYALVHQDLLWSSCLLLPYCVWWSIFCLLLPCLCCAPSSSGIGLLPLLESVITLMPIHVIEPSMYVWLSMLLALQNQVMCVCRSILCLLLPCHCWGFFTQACDQFCIFTLCCAKQMLHYGMHGYALLAVD
jgi:hypothetical protein